MSEIEKKEITVPEARELLEKEEEDLDPLQRRVLDYTIKFSRLSADDARELRESLMNEAAIDRNLAVQIVNCMPSSISELRTFLGRQRIIAEDTMNRILGIIEKYRSEE
ncbi:MAG: hypothetical protein ACLFVP_02200 [Candidatus Bathyarchaeia archaeon]